MQDDDTNALQRLWLGSSLQEPPPIGPDVIARLSEEFGMPADTVPIVGVVLNTAAHAYKAESRRARVDLARCRKDLAKIEKAARQLLVAIDAASPDAWSVLADARSARSLDPDTVEATVMLLATQAIEGRPHLPPAADDQFDPSELRKEVADLAAQIQASQRFAGAGKPGRPEDDAAFDLLHAVFQVWSSILGRDFRLDWTDDGAPITDAAQFCVAVARTVDPDIAAARIMGAARKVREKGIAIRDLQELPQVLREYRMRFE